MHMRLIRSNIVTVTLRIGYGSAVAVILPYYKMKFFFFNFIFEFNISLYLSFWITRRADLVILEFGPEGCLVDCLLVVVV